MFEYKAAAVYAGEWQLNQFRTWDAMRFDDVKEQWTLLLFRVWDVGTWDWIAAAICMLAMKIELDWAIEKTSRGEKRWKAMNAKRSDYAEVSGVDELLLLKALKFITRSDHFSQGEFDHFQIWHYKDSLFIDDQLFELLKLQSHRLTDGKIMLLHLKLLRTNNR